MTLEQFCAPSKAFGPCFSDGTASLGGRRTDGAGTELGPRAAPGAVSSSAGFHEDGSRRLRTRSSSRRWSTSSRSASSSARSTGPDSRTRGWTTDEPASTRGGTPGSAHRGQVGTLADPVFVQAVGLRPDPSRCGNVRVRRSPPERQRLDEAPACTFDLAGAERLRAAPSHDGEPQRVKVADADGKLVTRGEPAPGRQRVHTRCIWAHVVPTSELGRVRQNRSVRRPDH